VSACAGAAIVAVGAAGVGMVSAPAVAQEDPPGDTGIYGRNVVAVEWQGGAFRMIGPEEWGEFDAAGNLVRRYVEHTRDDWSVYFKAPDSGHEAHVDLLYNSAFRAEPGSGTYREVGRIIRATPRSDLPRVAVPPPPRPGHEWYAKRFGGAGQLQAGGGGEADSGPWQGGNAVAFGEGGSNGQGGSWQGSGEGQWQQQQQQAEAQWQPQQQPAWQQQQQPSAGSMPPWQQQPQQQASSGGFDPFGSSSPSSDTFAGAPSVQNAAPWQGGQSSGVGGQQTSAPPWQRQDTARTAQTGTGSAPPWAANPSNAGGAFAPGPQAAAAEPHAMIEGVWVELNALSRPEGDGRRSAITWSTPRYLRFIPLDERTVAFLTSDESYCWNVLTRQADDRYAGSGSTVTITERAGSYLMQVMGGGLAGSYEIARTADGYPSRDRFDPSDRDSRRGLFNQDGLTREWNTNFHSFDGLNMNLFDPLAGRKQQIFRQPGNFDYAIDDNLNLGLPFGLRGFRTRMSSSRQVETLVTNAAAFQRDMSMNFGGSLGVSPKANFGASYSFEKTSGTRSRSSEMNAIGYARIERYTLVLDEPNAQLSENFRRAIDSLADGRTSAGSVVNTFGTHYAKAISYGGLGKAEKTMTSVEVAEYLSSKQGFSAGGGAKGASLNGGFSEGRSSERSTESVFTRDEFTAVGGSGSMTSTGWQVSDSDTVPVRYDLRRLSDLINPILFDVRSPADATKYLRARNALRAEIDRRMNGAPDFANGYMGPRFFEIELHSLRCTNQGDDRTNTIMLRGTLDLSFTDDTGPRNVPLFNAAEGEAMTCGGSGRTLSQKPVIVLSSGSPEAGTPGFGAYTMRPSLTEVDDGPRRTTGEEVRDGFLTGFSLGIYNAVEHNADDPINQTPMMLPLGRDADGRRRSIKLGGNQAPTLFVDYTVRELK